MARIVFRGFLHARFIRWGMCRNRKSNFREHLFHLPKNATVNKFDNKAKFQLHNKFNLLDELENTSRRVPA